ncbi:efflux RND transporter permease subunit [Alcanivorax sediminis]|uniref:MMPL family transporter n=1 Tax=Alcanivorax sediminis TaxID=2663008 RepID=A0A6N7LWU3_9GAMM|nr:efflux RND transporter permease subunit [Alcanivorax sediminis]MQX53856.1 MMPL family transporter [Alcanivorax sediminis]
MKDAWSRWVVAHPVWVLAGCILLCMGLAGGMSKFQNNNDPRIFFTEDNPDFKRFVALEDNFTANEVVLFVIHPKDDQIFTRETLAAIEALTEDAWLLPHATRVDSLANFQHTEVEGDDLFVAPLVEYADQLSNEELGEIRQIALSEPSLIGRLISDKGHVAGIAATVTMGEGKTEAPEITEAAREMVRQYRERYPDIDFMVTGTVIFNQASAEATEQSMNSTLPLAFVVMLLCLWLILRSVMFVVVTLCVIGFSILSAMGLAMWLGIEFSPIVGMAPAMILTLAVADSVHILASYRHERLESRSREQAIVESLRINFQPVWLTSLTTAIGFAILNFSESQPFRALGNVVLIGVLLAFFFSVVLLPVLVMLIPHRIEPGKQRDFSPLMERLAQHLNRHYKPWLLGMSVLAVGLTASIGLNSINDVFNEYFDETFEVRRVNDFAMSEMTGMHRIDYAVPAADSGGAMDPEFQKNLDKLHHWVEQQEHVVYVTSYVNVIKRLNRDMHGGDPEYYRVPDSRELISQYTLLYELSLPQGLGLEDQLDIDKSQARVVVMLENIGSRPVLEFNQRVEDWMAENWPDYMQTKGTGMDVLFGHVTMRNINSMLSGALIALISVSVLLIIALRSFRYGLLSLIPNLLPAAMAFGLWGVINGEIGLAVSVVACMTLGIVVDDTVHFLSKYVRAKRELGLNTEKAVEYALRTVGVALVATSVVLVANFAVIGTSHFYPNSSMGLLSAITIAMALFVDLFFFVPLLNALDRRRKVAKG